MDDNIILPSDPVPSVLPAPFLTPSLETSITPRQAFVLAASSDTYNPALLALTHRTVTDCDHLNTQDRRVLRAVLCNIPADNALVRRMLALNPAQLQILAQVFEAGLIAARNFGGRPS